MEILASTIKLWSLFQLGRWCPNGRHGGMVWPWKLCRSSIAMVLTEQCVSFAYALQGFHKLTCIGSGLWYAAVNPRWWQSLRSDNELGAALFSKVYSVSSCSIAAAGCECEQGMRRREGFIHRWRGQVELRLEQGGRRRDEAGFTWYPWTMLINKGGF